MKKVVAEIRYAEDGGKVKRAEMAENKCGERNLGQQEQRKWGDSKS